MIPRHHFAAEGMSVAFENLLVAEIAGSERIVLGICPNKSPTADRSEPA